MEASIPLMILSAVVILGLFLLPGPLANRERARTRAQLTAIDRKLDAVLQHLEITIGPCDHPEVVRHLIYGRKIHAIKAYRDQTGATLADAKAEVERIARHHNL